jgi:hypothetical protein
MGRAEDKDEEKYFAEIGLTPEIYPCLSFSSGFFVDLEVTGLTTTLSRIGGEGRR